MNKGKIFLILFFTYIFYNIFNVFYVINNYPISETAGVTYIFHNRKLGVMYRVNGSYYSTGIPAKKFEIGEHVRIVYSEKCPTIAFILRDNKLDISKLRPVDYFKSYFFYDKVVFISKTLKHKSNSNSKGIPIYNKELNIEQPSDP
ncbi:hypothetical protein [Persicobacter diffluens]|uniref:Uncharacterized protein n=1 Tax=Persicobacter diffluens TaxID=981 RepID=A0AAN4W2X9_9BACT|nr:hypothetical protein PEDI_42150 [Persicobacter diffluens]